MNMFFLAGIGIGAFLQFLLISKKNKSAADTILTIWLFLIVVHLFVFYAFATEEVYNFPYLLGLEHPLPMLHGVFLYLYVIFVLRQVPAKKITLALHFVPVTIMYAWLIPFFALPGDQKIEVYRQYGAGHEGFLLFKTYAIAISGLFYVGWSALLLRRHAHTIREQFSDLGKVSLGWLQILTFGLGGIWLIVIFTRNDTMVFSGVVVFIFLIGFFGIRQAEIFTSSQSAPENEENETTEAIEAKEESDEPRKKYPKSGLTDDASEKLHGELIQAMTTNALYTRSDLSINDLAAELAVHPNYLSQTINQREQKNFYDFVNTYRIEEFKRRIAEPENQQFTLLSVAYDCGFNSKSSFNRYFKKATGQTPSQYLAAMTSDPGTPS